MAKCGASSEPTGRCTHCRRFTYGRAAVCRRRRCPGYAPIWAGDQRRKLFENLGAYHGECVVLAVTAPGSDQLPWDEKHCRPLGAHTHSGLLGCRVDRHAAREFNETTSDPWRRLNRRVSQAVRRHGVRSVLLVRAFERQHRGVLHVHPVLGFSTPAERHAVHLYTRYLSELAPRYGFGFTERKVSTRSGKRVAAYLSAYFVTGKSRKLSLQESVMASDMPRSIIYVTPELTQRTGVTMRELRLRRFVWFIANRTGCPLAEARLIAMQAIAGTLDLTVDVFTPSPRSLAAIFGCNAPPRGAIQKSRGGRARSEAPGPSPRQGVSTPRPVGLRGQRSQLDPEP